MSMAASIESRVPFLDHRLVEFAAALPPRMKLRGFKTKWILREAVRELLPPGILTRRKMGFPVPFGVWMKDRWQGVARDVLLDRRTRERGIIDPRAAEDLIESHAAGRRDGTDAIWSLLNLELWYRTFIDGDGVQVLSAPSSSEPAPPASATALSASATASASAKATAGRPSTSEARPR
jgi:asparagine synthase (glutamine-hydrolysing)